MMSLGRILAFTLISSLTLTFGGCEQSAKQAPVDDDATPSVPLIGVRLSDESRKAIGIVTTPIRQETVVAAVAATGWLRVQSGNEVTIKATATGYVLPSSTSGSSATMPKGVHIGDVISPNQHLGRLHLYLSPQEEAQLVVLKEEADIQILQALASLRIAQEKYKDLKAVEGRGVPAKELLVVKEQLERAQVAYKQAQEKLPFLPKEPYKLPLRFKDVSIQSPLSGRVTRLHVRSRQFVVQGDPMWTISDWSTLWLRVPVFDRDLARIRQSQPIRISLPGTSNAFTAQPVEIPQAMQDGKRTVDLFYRVDNPSGLLRPGQPLSVSLPTGDTHLRPMVPQSAVVWDGFGNAWVYVEAKKNEFERRRVELGTMKDNRYAVDRGLTEREKVVTVGAQALYGEEFKGQSPLPDDDD